MAMNMPPSMMPGGGDAMAMGPQMPPAMPPAAPPAPPAKHRRHKGMGKRRKTGRGTKKAYKK